MDDKQFPGNSLKVNVKRSSWNPNAGESQLKEELSNPELYKPIPEENLTPEFIGDFINTKDKEVTSKAADLNSSLTTSEIDTSQKMVQEENVINDGADEQMLGTEENEKLASKREEVKFIKGDQQNGDAKIDIGTINAKAFTGMSKEELMKYANDPFWVRLRWVFFILFWLIWGAMLAGAIYIIIQAPKCAAPKALQWYKQGVLARFESINGNNDLSLAKKVEATGVIYELPAELTYSVKEPQVEQMIKNLVSKYKDSDINIILDITPNYVNRDSTLMKNALIDESKRSPFIWIANSGIPNNWLSIVNGTAWAEVLPGNYVLSQFGDGLFDLNMNDTIVKKEFIDTLTHLMHLGVKGFRLKNTKFFLLKNNLQNETHSNEPGYIHTQYGFWTHKQTTFQEGLGDVLYEYLVAVKNISADAFFSVAEDIIRPEVYKTKDGEYGIDLPIYGRFTQSLNQPQAKKLHEELQNIFYAVGNHTWLQWNYADLNKGSPVDPSSYSLFLSLLPGVPIIPVDSEALNKISNATYKHIEQLRSSASYKYGDFEQFPSDEMAAYSRIKSGNPGYFVVFNPTNRTQTGNYTNRGLPEKMTVDVISDNFNVSGISVKSKVTTDSIVVSPYATIILTYVPVKSG